MRKGGVHKGQIRMNSWINGISSLKKRLNREAGSQKSEFSLRSFMDAPLKIFKVVGWFSKLIFGAKFAL